MDSDPHVDVVLDLCVGARFLDRLDHRQTHFDATGRVVDPGRFRQSGHAVIAIAYQKYKLWKIGKYLLPKILIRWQPWRSAFLSNSAKSPFSVRTKLSASKKVESSVNPLMSA